MSQKDPQDTEKCVLEKLEDPQTTPALAREKLIQSMLAEKLKVKEAPKIYKVERSSVLDKVKSFLPVLQDSNSKLESSSSNLDIESISDEFKDSYIEMSFACMEEEGGGEESVAARLASNIANCDDSSDDSDDEVTEKSEAESEKPSKVLIQEI